MEGRWEGEGVDFEMSAEANGRGICLPVCRLFYFVKSVF
jgi:hypothetical protein